ncbi:hypothetical protein J4E08_15810 [Sagittula sp. NFXS13]|uniref:ImuA family protein n=1 Tax=Sagittula sp. NFXS13 TaxID=2819095 RepID=UPI0032DFBCF9
MKTSALLTRGSHRSPPSLSLVEGIDFVLSRVHEICGAARRTLALQVAARALQGRDGPLIWITADRDRTMLCAPAVAAFLPPGRVLFVTPEQRRDGLWAMEEALKDGGAPVVVTEVAEPPGMTPVRRLHLAAETGATSGPHIPLGLLLTPGDGGAPGIETRWRCDPAHMETRPGWRLERLRARMLPPSTWHWTGTKATAWTPTPQQAPPGQPAPVRLGKA